LLVGIPTLDHTGNKVVVFLLVLFAGLGVETDNRQKVLSVGEHFLLDYHTQLLVTEPGGVLAIVIGTRTQHEVDDFVAEILRVTDAGWFFDFFQFFVQGYPIKDFAGFRVAVLLVLNPEVSIKHVAVKDVLPVFAIDSR